MGLKLAVQWVFRSRVSDSTRCKGCRKPGLKTEMFHLDGSGYFCSREEAWDYWSALQW
jgi:hypothetical protein